MKLGDVLRKERRKASLSTQEVAQKMSLATEAYEEIEAGDSAAEVWGPRLALIAIELETPTSRLLATSGRAADTVEGQAGGLIKGHRERREKSVEQLATALEITTDDYAQIEAGESPLETLGPLLLAFSEAIEQPVFNLFYPCGLPFQELDDYP